MEKLQEEEGGENDLTMLFQEEMKRCETPGVTVAPAVSATSRNPSKSQTKPHVLIISPLGQVSSEAAGTPCEAFWTIIFKRAL